MTNWEMFLAAACYRRDQARCWWLNHTGRCSACPKRVRGPHKLACSRTNTQIKLSMRRGA